MAIWRDASSVRACKCARSECAREKGPGQVARSASITATPVTVYLSASCGLWASAQQSRLTVIPSGVTNCLSCLILACNSWMWRAALIGKNFHQQAAHLCYETWRACGHYSVMSFADFQPSLWCQVNPTVSPNRCGSRVYILGRFSRWPFSS